MPGGSVSIKRLTELEPEIRVHEDWYQSEEVRDSSEKSGDYLDTSMHGYTFSMYSDQTLQYALSLREENFESLWNMKLTIEDAAQSDNVNDQLIYRWNHSFDILFTVK